MTARPITRREMSELCPTANLPLLADRWPLAVTLTLIKLARCLEALDSLLPLSCSSRFRGMATASVPHCRKSQLHAKGVRLATHWHSTNPRAKCHTPQTECAQEGLSAMAGGYCLAWGNVRSDRQPCRCGRAQQSFPWKPQLPPKKVGADSPSVPEFGRHPRILQRAGLHISHRTASSKASQRCQPCLRLRVAVWCHTVSLENIPWA